MNTNFQQPNIPQHPNRFINMQLIKGPQVIEPQSRPSSRSPPVQSVPVVFRSIEGHQQNNHVKNQGHFNPTFYSPPPGIPITTMPVQNLKPVYMEAFKSQNKRLSPAIKPQSVKRMENIVLNTQLQHSKQSSIEYLDISSDKPKIKQKSASPRSMKPNLIITGPPPSQNMYANNVRNPENLMRNGIINSNYPITRQQLVVNNVSRQNQRRNNSGIEVTLSQEHSKHQEHRNLSTSRERRLREGIEVVSKNGEHFKHNNSNTTQQNNQTSSSIDHYKQSVIKQAQSQNIHIQQSNQPPRNLSPSQNFNNAQNKTVLKVYTSYDEYLNEKNSHQNQANNNRVHQLSSHLSFNNNKQSQIYNGRKPDIIIQNRPHSQISNGSYLSGQRHNSHSQSHHSRSNSHYSYTSKPSSLNRQNISDQRSLSPNNQQKSQNRLNISHNNSQLSRNRSVETHRYSQNSLIRELGVTQSQINNLDAQRNKKAYQRKLNNNADKPHTYETIKKSQTNKSFSSYNNDINNNQVSQHGIILSIDKANEVDHRNYTNFTHTFNKMTTIITDQPIYQSNKQNVENAQLILQNQNLNQNKGIAQQLRRQFENDQKHKKNNNKRYESSSETYINILDKLKAQNNREWPSQNYFSFRNIEGGVEQNDEDSLSIDNQYSDQIYNLKSIIQHIYQKEKQKGLEKIRSVYNRTKELCQI